MTQPSLCPSPFDDIADTPKAQVQDPFAYDSGSEHRKTRSEDTTQPAKTHNRQNRDRERVSPPNGPLTPPLTPASSINTLLSTDSTTSEESKVSRSDVDSQATHFLLISNLSRSLVNDQLQSAVYEAFASVMSLPSSTRSSLSASAASHESETKKGPPKIEFIRATNTIRIASHGEAILAFYDVRMAAKAFEILSENSDGALAACIEAESSTLKCQFLSKAETVELLGNSVTLSSIDGGLFVSHPLTSFETEPSGTSDSDWVSTATDEARQSFRTKAAIRGFFESYGPLRTLELVQDNQADVQTYRLEFFDYRHAKLAETQLNNQDLSGTKLKVFRAKHLPEKTSLLDEKTDPAVRLSATPSAPTLSPHKITSIGTPGQHSQIRERFQFDGAHPDASAVIPDTQKETNTCTSRTVDPTSQTIYYTSPSGTAVASSPNTVTPVSPVEDGSANVGGDSSHSELRPAHPNIRLQTENIAHGQHTPAYPYASPGDFYYYPSSASPMTPVPHAYYAQGATSTPPTSPVYYHGPHLYSPGGQAIVYAGSPAPTVGYEYDTHAAMAVYAHPTYSYEHGMMSPAPGSIPYHFGYMPVQGTAQDADFWTRQGAVPSAETGRYHGPPMMRSFYPSASPNTSPEDISPVTPYFSPGQSNPDPHSAPGLSPHAAKNPSSTLLTNRSKEPVPTPERNQLNITKIEDGQDTRTTVMIKNIPNKMTDRELIAYIGKVCSRRIDFLYLRMDFQNGCNVGYAFVNFISVQDLLTFAKKRLGEKWNMFSSEKVLQMSYANYQGKEALIEKFKNSCIMDERESWRPKIFFSDGPEQGLPEPFPPPTHLRRKERSSFNRGALYVPGVNNNGTALRNGFSSIRRRDDGRRFDRYRLMTRTDADVEEDCAEEGE